MTREDFANHTRTLQRDFMKETVAKFGVPEIIKTDNGLGFKCKCRVEMESLLEEKE